MFEVKTHWFQQYSVYGESRCKQLSGDTRTLQWHSDVADYIASFLSDHPKVRFSGMEEFGSGSCVLEPISSRCRTHGDCRKHFIEAVRTWTKSSVQNLQTGDPLILTSSGRKWVSLEIKALPAPDDNGPAEDETYLKRTAFGHEVRQIGHPVTHGESSAKSLAEGEQLVRARPFYSIPDRPGGLTKSRAPFTYEARVIGTSGPDMVIVQWTWHTDAAPWPRTGIFKPTELHDAWECDCAACHGRIGIQEMDGA
ncbi:hypothetical protein [Streptomyces sp. NRRL F-5053]|uniref:hypothetical protein n=1 Tax=Streptomyces sp. NRRL F-5053 TaxID=1463854 RepID=UPI0013314DFD|nr:hypothetical protein [Streptomyces sp. NRRL F-5053]